MQRHSRQARVQSQPKRSAPGGDGDGEGASGRRAYSVSALFILTTDFVSGRLKAAIGTYKAESCREKYGIENMKYEVCSARPFSEVWNLYIGSQKQKGAGVLVELVTFHRGLSRCSKPLLADLPAEW